MRIIFMGTPEFAVPSLEILIENKYNVVAVITAPDKPAGRGNQLHLSEVKKCALKHNLTILQPTNLKSPEFVEELKTYQADLQIVVAFRMLPEVIWNMPPKGTFNLHASLLPQYRGAAPINWAIINGEKETGATTFFLKHEIDTGNVIFQEKEPIDEKDNVGMLYERLMQKGANLVLKTVKAIQTGNYPQLPQHSTEPLKHAPKIFKETCQIDWHKTSEEIYNFVRGLSPYPAAWIELQGKNCKVFQVSCEKDWDESRKKVLENYLQEINKLEIGNYYTDKKHFLIFKTGQGLIAIEELQIEGKKRMPITAFLVGWKV